MDKNKRNFIFLGIAILAILFVWGSAAKKKETRALLPKPAMTANVSQRNVRTQFSDWGRNPFMLSGELSESVRGLLLDGIVWDEAKPYAIINNQVLGIGGTIGRNRITKITKTAVFLEEDGNEFSMPLRNVKEISSP